MKIVLVFDHLTKSKQIRVAESFGMIFCAFSMQKKAWFSLALFMPFSIHQNKGHGKLTWCIKHSSSHHIRRLWQLDDTFEDVLHSQRLISKDNKDDFLPSPAMILHSLLNHPLEKKARMKKNKYVNSVDIKTGVLKRKSFKLTCLSYRLVPCPW